MTTDLPVRPLSGTIGAEVSDVRLSRDISKETISAIKAALLRYKVLFFPDQRSFTEDDQIAFGMRFGSLETDYPSFATRMKDRPEVIVFDGAAPAGRASVWHTDATVSRTPPMAGIIRIAEVPDRGGDTMWCDTASAFNSLSDPLKQFLATKTAVHDLFSDEYIERTGVHHRRRTDVDLSRVSRCEHPVVRVHPETGEQCLFINPLFTSHIVGLHSRESALLLNYLFEQMQRSEFTVRRHWSRNDVGFWDNRCTMHAAIDDYGTGRRLAYRVCIKGDVPVGSPSLSMQH
jgi:taurine dioxygenase